MESPSIIPIIFDFDLPNQSLTEVLPEFSQKDYIFKFYYQNQDIFTNAEYSNIEQNISYDTVLIIADQSGFHVRDAEHILQRRFFKSNINRMYLFGVLAALQHNKSQNIRFGIGSKLVFQYFNDVFPTILKQKRYSPLSKSVKNPIANPDIVINLIKEMHNRSIIFYFTEQKSAQSVQQLTLNCYSDSIFYDQFYEFQHQKKHQEQVVSAGLDVDFMQFQGLENSKQSEPVQKSIKLNVVDFPDFLQPKNAVSKSLGGETAKENELAQSILFSNNNLKIVAPLNVLTEIALFLEEQIVQKRIELLKIEAV